MSLPSAHRPDPSRSPSIMTEQDVRAFRADFYVRLPETADAALAEAFEGHDDVVFLARQWGWADTEVRDAAAAILEEALGRDLP